MDRNRESRRGTMAAVNGGLSRRRQRNSGLRDSPEEDGGMEMHETTRLRDRGSKKDRDRDRSSRSKRRRGERMLHGSNRDEGEDSSEESLDEEEEDDEDDAAVRLPPPPLNPTAPPSSLLSQNHHHRKSFPAKAVRVPPWKAADEIGVPIPKKARSASAKRSPECWVSGGGGGGGGGGGEQIQRQPSTSPSRLSPASTAQISPSSSNTSLRKKMKPISGTKQRPPKMSKSSSIQEEIEIEVAEVLFKLKSKQESHSHRLDSKDTNGSCNEAKSRVSSPNSISPHPASQQSVLAPSNLSSNASLAAVAPKRKRPRPVKFEDESPTSPVSSVALPSGSVPSAAKMDMEQPTRSEATSPKSEKKAPSLAGDNGGGSIDFGVPQAGAVPCDAQQDLGKPDNNLAPESKVLTTEPDGRDQMGIKEEVASPRKITPGTDLSNETMTAKAAPVAESGREEKFCIDLMAPPPGKSSPERDDYFSDQKSVGQEIELMSKIDDVKKEGEEAEMRAKQNAAETLLEERKPDRSMTEESDLKKQMGKERTLDLQLDLEKPDKDGLGSSKHLPLKQQSKSSKIDPKPEKTGPSASLPMPMTVAGWPGGLPPFGYMGQVPSLPVPLDGAAGSPTTLQPPNFLSPPVRPSRCATHCYIAKNILYHQRIARMNPFWPAAAGTTPLFGGKPYNLNIVPPSEPTLLGNPLQGSFPGRSLGALQDNKGAPIVAAFTGQPTKDKISTANTNFMEAAQRKQLALQQTQPQPGSVSNMLQSPAFIFPLNQQQAAAAAAAAAIRSGAAKSTQGAGNAAPSSSATSSAVVSSGVGGPAAAMNFGYAVPPNDTYLAILNNGYPFPIPAHVGGPTYRGAPAQAMPFFNGSFYAAHMLPPSHLQQQLPSLPTAAAPQQPPHAQPGHQHTSTSSGSSSSQKHPQKPKRIPGGLASGAGMSSHNFPSTKQRLQLQPHQARQLESETGCEDSPSTADSRVSQAQKSLYVHNLTMPIHPPNIALMSTAAAATALGSGGGHSEKQPIQQQQQSLQQLTMKVELTPSQAFAMSFASSLGAVPSGLDFSSMLQNHALFQSHPEAARQGYQITAAAAAAAVAAQHKKAHLQAADDGKSSGDSSMNANMAGEEEKKMVVATSKAPGISSSQHSLAFSKPDRESPISTVLGNSVVDSSSRALNLIPATANGSRTSNRSAASPGPPTTTAPMATTNVPNFQQFHLQKQPQELQHQLPSTRSKSTASSNNAGVYSERLPSGSTATKFSQALTGFPQGLIQAGSPAQSPQWKASGRAGTPAASPSPDPLAVKNHLLQQQGRAAQQTLPSPSHQNQISFGVNSLKAAPTGAQHLSGGGASSVSASAAAAAMAVGSPTNSVSKSTGGSPRASTSTKPAQPAMTSPLVQQSSTKSSASSSSRKLSPNRNVPSILGHPQLITPAMNSSASQQLPQLQPQYRMQKQSQQLLQKQPQLFFSNAAYMQAQLPQSSAAAAAAGYYQRRQSEQQYQQQQKQSSNTVSTGMLALCSSALTLTGTPATSDPAKAVDATANSMKGLPSPGLLHAAHLAAAAAQSASGAPHHLMSAAAAAAAFPYMSMPPVSMKPSDQKPAAGNDNLHACWQPEKR